jgi:hypothetical protein
MSGSKWSRSTRPSSDDGVGGVGGSVAEVRRAMADDEG